MEINKAEVRIIEEAIQQNAEKEIKELGDLQLALVGGGMGEHVWG